MSRTARRGAVIIIVAAVSLSSCARPSVDPIISPLFMANATAPIHINFTCDGTNQISLTDDAGDAAWSFEAKKFETVSWVVPANVSINGISSKVPSVPLPLSTPGPQGGKGNPYTGQVNATAQSKRHYLYNIDVTCAPLAGPAVRLVIDPDMIIF